MPGRNIHKKIPGQMAILTVESLSIIASGRDALTIRELLQLMRGSV